MFVSKRNSRHIIILFFLPLFRGFLLHSYNVWMERTQPSSCTGLALKGIILACTVLFHCCPSKREKKQTIWFLKIKEGRSE